MKKLKTTLHFISTVSMALFAVSCGVDKISDRTVEEYESKDATSTNLVSPLQITHLSLIYNRTGKTIDGYSNIRDQSNLYLEDLPRYVGIKAHFNEYTNAKNVLVKIQELDFRKTIASPYIFSARLPQKNMQITVSLRARDLNGVVGETRTMTLNLKTASRPDNLESDDSLAYNEAGIEDGISPDDKIEIEGQSSIYAGENFSKTYTYTKRIDLGYCKAGNTQLKLDLAMPTNVSKPRPGVIFVHGGGWTSGSKNAFRNEMLIAAQNGYVAISIDYRLSGELVTGQVKDIKCAVRWLKSHASQYNVNTQRIALVGKSAGSHLAMLAAFAEESSLFADNTQWGQQSNKVQAISNWYGVSDMAAFYDGLSGTKKYQLGLVANGRFTEFSPTTYLDSMDPPIQTLHGTIDSTVPYSQSQILKQVAASKNVEHSLITFTGAGHGFSGTDLTRARNELIKFLNENLRY